MRADCQSTGNLAHLLTGLSYATSRNDLVTNFSHQGCNGQIVGKQKLDIKQTSLSFNHWRLMNGRWNVDCSVRAVSSALITALVFSSRGFTYVGRI